MIRERPGLENLKIAEIPLLSKDKLLNIRFGNEHKVNLGEVLTIMFIAKSESVPQNIIDVVCENMDPKYGQVLKISLDNWNKSEARPVVRESIMSSQLNTAFGLISMAGVGFGDVKSKKSNLTVTAMMAITELT